MADIEQIDATQGAGEALYLGFAKANQVITKINAIEAGATQDQSGAEIKALLEALIDKLSVAAVKETDTKKVLTATERTSLAANIAKLAGIEANAKDDQTGEEIAALIEALVVLKTLFDANTVLVANADDTPLALTVAEQRLVGRITGGNIVGLTAAQVRTLLSVLSNIVEDITPQLGGELDCQAHTIGFTQQVIAGNGTTTIDWKLGNKVYFTFGAQNDIFTFSAPTHECNLLLVLKQDGTGSRLATWPATVMWPAGTAPTLSTAAAAVDIVMFYWDGTNYLGGSILGLAVPA